MPFASDNDKGTNIRRVIMTHLFAIATPAQVRDILFGEAKYDSPEMMEAIERSAAIFRKGYSDGKLGNTLTSDAATPDFAAGRNIFWISGTFNGKRYKAQLKDFPDLDWGYMDLPPINKSLKWTTVAGVGSGVRDQRQGAGRRGRAQSDRVQHGDGRLLQQDLARSARLHPLRRRSRPTASRCARTTST